jgi:transcriptional regulator with GAF, ATPase, and Fis domain
VFDLPRDQTTPAVSAIKPRDENTVGPELLTEAEMRQYERDNLMMALEKAGWKIKGPNGAAELLGIHPATLVSRMKKWGLERQPAR